MPRTSEQLHSLPEHVQEARTKSLNAISRMRADGITLYSAAREYGVDPRTVIRWGKPALRKRKNGRYAAKRSDRLLRVLNIPAEHGAREIAVLDSRQASEVGKYSAAVQRYLATGDASSLRAFRGKEIELVDGARLALLTGLKDLDRLGSAGVLSFESLYSRSA